MTTQDPPSPPAGPDSGELDLLHDRSQIDAAVKRILEQLAAMGYSDSSRFAVRLAIEEGISNAFRHGHRELPASTPIHLSYSAKPDQLRVVITDRGPGFDPSAVPDPTLEQNLEVPSGRGLMLMRAYMTQVSFNPVGNQVTLVYRKPPPKA